MNDLDDFKATYFDECSELLLELEEQFTAIQDGDRAPDRLNAVFRAIHSIKGGAGAFGFTGLVQFAHAFETLLDNVRDGRVELTPEVIALCIRSNDLVADFVAAARAGEDMPEDHGAEEKARFDTLTRGEGDESEPMEDFDIAFEPVMVRLDHAEAELLDAAPSDPDGFAEAPLAGEDGLWEISFRPRPELYARANDPLLLFRELACLGEIEITASLRDLPPLADFEPNGAYCAWAVSLRSRSATEASIRDVFEFVDGDCDLAIVALAPGEAVLARDVDLQSEPDLPADLPSFADLAAEVAPPPKPKLHVVSSVAPGGETDADGDKRPVGVQSIRVDLDKADRVVNMVGELVITQSMLTQQMDENLRVHYQELVRGLEVLAQTTRGLQDSVMAIRAQPVKSVFSRMPRLARELATKTGKKIKLETIGENTEIDKTVIEQLSDPLTHMIRNSADHGLEAPEKRLAIGKQETGTIRLSAEQAGGNILIIVEDDGAGINRERVLQVARDRGVVGPDQQLTEEQIDNLIFAPGFSTADAVSDLSGRGVGMDVVLSNIKKIGGSVVVRSWPGRGTRVTLKLPLTLAVLDVMLVKVAASPYVVPLSSIVETMQCARAAFSRTPSGDRVLAVRGEYLQVIDLAAQFGMQTEVPDQNRFVVLCEGEGQTRVALVVDDIIGQQQVVIKSLEENFERIEGIAGGTILGDGSVALIVDVQGLRTAPPHLSAA